MPPSEAAPTERRVVRSEDPSLTPEANRLLTEELREVVGADEVEVPVETPRRAAQPHANRSRSTAVLASNRVLVVVSLATAVVVGAVVSFATGWYGAVVIALVLHAVGTLLVAATGIQLTTQVEHVAPDTAARLEDEGVADPDRVLGELVEDFTGTTEAGGVPEVVSSGHNDRATPVADDAATAGIEQRTALTPGSDPSRPTGEGSAVALLPWGVVVGLMVLSVIVAPIVSQGWVAPLIVVPLGLAWIALQRWLTNEPAARSERPVADDGQGARRRLAPLVVFVAIGVAWFALVMGALGDVL